MFWFLIITLLLVDILDWNIIVYGYIENTLDRKFDTNSTLLLEKSYFDYPQFTKK